MWPQCGVTGPPHMFPPIGTCYRSPAVAAIENFAPFRLTAGQPTWPADISGSPETAVLRLRAAASGRLWRGLGRA
jgi:hypothetical protein